MPLGISPLNDFAFKKTFGTPEFRESLISLLNAILNPKLPIADVTIQNPFNYQDFQDDKLSILDVKAIDDSGALFDVEVQLRTPAGLDKRLVFYGCELYADQLRAGMPYADLPPVFSIWLINGVLWPEGLQFHHAFRLTDPPSGRILDGTLAIHTIELPKYNSRKSDAPVADMLACWMHWLKHAQDYEPEELLTAFPQPAIRRASEALSRIAQFSEDKAMYDARERSVRDRQWEIDAAKREGKLEGEIKLIHVLQGLLCLPLNDEKELAAMNLSQLESMAGNLQAQLRSRTPA